MSCIIVIKSQNTVLTPNNPLVIPSNGTASAVITVEKQDGNGSIISGAEGESVQCRPKGCLIPTSNKSLPIDPSGKVEFTIGPIPSGHRGDVILAFSMIDASGSNCCEKQIICRWQ